MFAWPAAWFSLLIYGVGRPLIPEGGTTPTWLRLAILTLGTGLELLVAILLLRREARSRDLGWLRKRIRLRRPRGWKRREPTTCWRPTQWSATWYCFPRR